VQPSASALKQLYRETCDEYNRSLLAVKGGFSHEPNDFTLLQLQEVVKRLPPTGGVFLDIGTGSGIVPRAIHKLGVRSITVDWPATGSEDAVGNARDAGVEGYYGQVGHDPLPVSDASVDCVLLADVIEHLLHSPKPVLADILRVLKPGGVCIATTPNALRLTVRLKVLFGYSNWPLVFDYYDSAFHSGHHHEYAIDEFRGVFKRAGFVEAAFLLREARLGRTRISRVGEIRTRSRVCASVAGGVAPLFGILSSALAIISGVVPRLRSEMLIVSRKP